MEHNGTLFPPLARNKSLASILISSKVSIQSDANPGHITKTFFNIF